jgi:hypothetical protein
MCNIRRNFCGKKIKFLIMHLVLVIIVMFLFGCFCV